MRIVSNGEGHRRGDLTASREIIEEHFLLLSERDKL